MLKLMKTRAAALAILALATLRIGTAQAAVGAWDQCDSEALGVLIGVCDYLTGGDWNAGYIVYTCDADGHLDNFYGACYSS